MNLRDVLADPFLRLLFGSPGTYASMKPVNRLFREIKAFSPVKPLPLRA